MKDLPVILEHDMKTYNVVLTIEATVSVEVEAESKEEAEELAEQLWEEGDVEFGDVTFAAAWEVTS